MKSELTIIKIGGKIISDSELLEKYLKKLIKLMVMLLLFMVEVILLMTILKKITSL